MSELEFRAQLEEIGRHECLSLVASTSVGRLAYCTGRWAAVVPVNHALIADEIVVRVAPSGRTAGYLRETGPSADVVYEVDAFDEATQSGWSVLVKGTAHVTSPDLLLTAADPPVPWPAGSFWNYVRIHPVSVSGRRLVSA